jgi:SAM-dependent methyltransferase
MTAGEYALANAWEFADRRLASLERGHDPATVRRLRDTGLHDGWNCLEVGAGRGSIVRFLSEQVGRRGRVVAIDLDVRFLERIRDENVEVLACDVVNDPLPAGPFDLVHTRLLLMHLPARDQVLERLIGVLRPGGVLLLEEHDIFPVLATADGAYGEAWSIFARAMEAAGVAPAWARGLPALCSDLGLVEVTADVDVPLFDAASPEAEFWRLTWQQAADRVAAAGAPRAVVDAGIAALAEPGAWFYGPAMVAVSGRRP